MAVETGGLAVLLEQTARMIHIQSHRGGLFSAQWTALRYFAFQPEHLRTTADLMRYQGISLTTAARTVRTLIKRGLIETKPNPRSKRAHLNEVTAEGFRLLENDPLHDLERVLMRLSPERRTALALVLEDLTKLLPETALDDGDDGSVDE